MKFVSVGNICQDRIMRYTDHIAQWGTEVFFDESEERIGGQAANFAMAASRLGHDTTLMANIGNDETAKSMLSELRSIPRLSCALVSKESSRTGYTVAVVRTDGERSFFTYLGHQGRFSLTRNQNELLGRISKNDLIHVSGFFMLPRARSETADFVRRIKEERKGIVSFDPGWDPSGFDVQAISEIYAVLDHVEYFEPNEIELLSLTKERSLQEAISIVRRRFAGVMALKLGSEGSIVTKGTDQVFVPSFRIRVKDTTGAGDAFDAGFLTSACNGDSLEECGKLGNAVGSLTISRTGNSYLRFPTLAHARRLMAARR
jgi:sugar/nucleoside kinase (ribokinase family)